MFVAGPVVRDAHIEARITVRKTGDPTARSKVRVYTLDGSAKAGKAYEPMTEVSKICSSPKMFFETEDRRRNWFGLFLVCIHFASCLRVLCSRSLRFAFRLYIQLCIKVPSFCVWLNIILPLHYNWIAFVAFASRRAFCSAVHSLIT